MSEAEYTGALNVVSKVVKEEGFLGLWKGFLPYYLRVAPHTVSSVELLFLYKDSAVSGRDVTFNSIIHFF